MARIAIGGFQHETNTFSPVPAALADFEAPDAWPGLTRGGAMLEAVAGINLPAAGFLQEARSLRHELLRRVRALVGPDVPVIASLDYHANVSTLMTQAASALVSYRTYPHIDMAECGAQAARVLQDLLGHTRPAVALEQVDYLMPLTSQSTLVEPMRSLMDHARKLQQSPLLSVCLMPGFPAADVADCGPTAYACGYSDEAARQSVANIVRDVRAREHEFALELYSIEQAIVETTRHVAPRGRPIILADTQDNPGAGGHADTMSLIKALVASKSRAVLAGVICDPEAAARAHAAGEGALVDLQLGARTGTPGETPLAARYRVLTLGDGRFTGTGPFYRGGRFELGPMALLEVGDVHIAVASRKQQAADQAMFRHLRVEPAGYAVLALKSSVHFRADFGPLASRVLVIEAPGPNVADPAQLPFRKLRPGMRTSPQRR